MYLHCAALCSVRQILSKLPAVSIQREVTGQECKGLVFDRFIKFS